MIHLLSKTAPLVTLLSSLALPTAAQTTVYQEGGATVTIQGGGGARVSINGKRLDKPGAVPSGNGEIRSTVRTILPFTQVVANGAGTIRIRNGEKHSVAVRIDSNLQHLLTTDSWRGVLYIAQRGSYRSTSDVIVDVVMPLLESISVRGASSVRIDGDFTYKLLHVSLEGTGGITAAGGRADEVVVRVAGTGSARLRSLAARVARVSAHGTGSVDLTVREEADITAAGTGDVTIYGRPKKREFRETGTGEVFFR